MSSSPPGVAPADRDARLADLMHRCARGDQGAFRELYALTSPQLLALLIRMLRRRDVAEEVQGLAFHVGRARPWGFLKKPMSWLEPSGLRTQSSSLTVGQTIFSPHNIVTYQPPPGDRPFAGFLWVGAESSWVREESKRDPEDAVGKAHRQKRVTLHVDVGMIGPASLSYISQSSSTSSENLGSPRAGSRS